MGSRVRRGGAVPALDFVVHDATDAGSLAILISDLTSRTGIYWLTFDDGEEYVGQSVEVVNRLASHRRHQRGQIVSVAFAPVPAESLDVAERWFIEQRDLANARLRNKLITRTPGGPAPGVFTVMPGVTVALPWEREARVPIPGDWTPPVPVATPRQEQQWDTLQRHESWPEIRTFLRAFLRETMSSPHLTAGRLWTISAMPNTVRRPGWFRLCTLNVGRIEAVYIGQDADYGAVVCWNVDVPEETPREDVWRALRRVGPRSVISGGTHHHYSNRVLALTAIGAEPAIRALGEPLIANLAYRFNTRYQRQGMALHRRFHNQLMAADLLGS